MKQRTQIMFRKDQKRHKEIKRDFYPIRILNYYKSFYVNIIKFVPNVSISQRKKL